MDFYSSRRNMNSGHYRGASASSGLSQPSVSAQAETGEDKEVVKASSCGSRPPKPTACGGCAPAPFPCSCGSKPDRKPGCSQGMMPGCSSNVMPGCGSNVMPGSGSNVMPGMGAGIGNRPMQQVPCCGCRDKCTDTSPGPLEHHYPIAMAYVPWQQWQKLYSMEEGFCKGTIFPDLYLPFQPRGCRV